MKKIHSWLAAAIVAMTAAGCAKPTEQSVDAAAASAQATVETVYSGFAAGDIEAVTSVMAPDIAWREAQGNPYADKNPYIGPEAVVTGLFARLGGEWDSFTATPVEYVSQGDRVVVFGHYSGTYIASGKTMNTPFVHSWTVKDGKIIRFDQFTDTAGQHDAMTVDAE